MTLFELKQVRKYVSPLTICTLTILGQNFLPYETVIMDPVDDPAAINDSKAQNTPLAAINPYALSTAILFATTKFQASKPTNTMNSEKIAQKISKPVRLPSWFVF